MPDIFISYRRIPSAMLAQLIASKLREYGLTAYVDTRQLDGATQFPERLLTAIENSDVFVCLIADSTFDSEWVRREIEHAYKLDKPLIPVFQESYESISQAPTAEITALLGYDGIHIFDIKNVLVDEAIEDLARMVKKTSSKPFTRKSPNWIWLVSIFFVSVAVLFLLLNALNIIQLIPTPQPTLDERSQAMTVVAIQQTGTTEANKTATFGAIMTSFVTETKVAISGDETATAEGYTDTPTSTLTATNTPTEDFDATANAQATLDYQATLKVPTNTPPPTATTTLTLLPTLTPSNTPTLTMTATSDRLATQTAEWAAVTSAKRNAERTQTAEANVLMDSHYATAIVSGLNLEIDECFLYTRVSLSTGMYVIPDSGEQNSYRLAFLISGRPYRIAGVIFRKNEWWWVIEGDNFTFNGSAGSRYYVLQSEIEMNGDLNSEQCGQYVLATPTPRQ